MTLRAFVIGSLLEALNKTSNEGVLSVLLDHIEKSNTSDLGLLFLPLLSSYVAVKNPSSTPTFGDIVQFWLPTSLSRRLKTRVESARIAFGISVLISNREASAEIHEAVLNSAANFCRVALATFSDPIEKQPWFGSFIELHYLLQQRANVLKVSAFPTLAAMDRFDFNNSKRNTNGAATSSINVGAAASNLSQQLSSSNDILQVLKDLGPSCTSSTSRFRETLRQILLSSQSLDEKCLAHMVYFFASQASYSGSGVTVIDKEVSGIVVATLLPKSVTDAEDAGVNSDRTGDTSAHTTPPAASALNLSTNGWNIDVISQVLSEDYGGKRRDWNLVARSMETIQGFRIRGSAQLEIFLDVFRRSSGGLVFPPSVVVREWNHDNVEGQLSLMAALASSSLQQGSGKSSSETYVFPLDEGEMSDLRLVGQQQPPLHYTPWACGVFLHRLLLILDYEELKAVVWKIFDEVVNKFPHLLLCAFVRLDHRLCAAPSSPDHNRISNLAKDVICQLSLQFFQPSQTYSWEIVSLTIKQMWSIDRSAVHMTCRYSWNRSKRSNVPQATLATALHILDIMRVIGPDSVSVLLSTNSKDNSASFNESSKASNSTGTDDFTLAMAFLSADQKWHDLAIWLGDRVSTQGLPCLIQVLSFLQGNVESSHPLGASRSCQALVSKENLFSAMNFLLNLDSSTLNQSLSSAVSGASNVEISSSITVGDSLKQLMELCIQRYPDIASSLSVGNTGSTGGAGSTDDIEEMANSYFQKIYTSENGINEVVDMLKKFKVSGNQRENDIFACMIHNLFDEYRFFSKYPEKELRITGILFGKLIKEQLVSSITLGIALRYVLEALRKDPGAGGTNAASGKMFRFGMFALEQFKERLHEWPQYCSHIVQIAHLKTGYQQLVAEIDEASHASQTQQQIQQLQQQQLQQQATTSGSSIISGASGTLTPVASAPSSPRVPPRSRAASDDSSSMNILPSNLPTTSDFLNKRSSSGSNMPTNITQSSLTPLPHAKAKVSEAAMSLAPRREAVFGPGLGKAFHKQVSDVLPEAPSDKTADRVQFIINNLSLSNVESKSRELVDVLPAQNFQWFASILVVKRISTQPNFHALYLTLLDNLGEYGKGLVDAILENVYLNIGKLLRSTKITTSTSERSLLKNLGSWLGQMTLRRNRPILQVTLDCKELLYQGYETGRLIAVTPFVAKILEGAKNSFVFKPPNPWVMGLLGVFRALYDVDDLKMNIKFEVEVLCKNLGVKLEDIPSHAKHTLALRIPPTKEKNPDFNVKSSTTSSTSTGVVIPPAAAATTPDRKVSSGAASSIGSLVGTVSAMNGDGGQAQVPTAASAANTAAAVSSEQQQPIIPKLAEFVTVDSQLYQLTSLSPSNLQRVVILAVDRAICEVIHPIIERSVSIACTTTKEILTKDFAMESDENRLRKASRLMVANLAGSLALVSCREALRSSLSNHLRVLISQEIVRTNNPNANLGSSTASVVSQLTDQEKAGMEHCVLTCASDNLELGCTLIEKAVIEKAVRDTDDALLPQYQVRAKHREETGQPYYDLSIFSSSQRYPAALPELLRPKPGTGLRPEQLMVYEAFQSQPVSVRPPISSASSSRQPTPTPQQQEGVSAAAASPGGASTSSAGGNQNWSLEALSSLATKLNNSVSAVLAANVPRASEITLSMLPTEHDIKQLLLAVQRYAAHARQNRPLSAVEAETVLGFAQSVFRRLYDLTLTEPLRLEALVALLEALNECCPQLGQDMGTWATYAPTETEAQRQLHLTILLLLVRSRLIPVREVDEFLTKSADQGRNTKWLDFAVLFVRAAVLERIALSADMPQTIRLLQNIVDNGAANIPVLQEYVKPVSRILDEIHQASGDDDSSIEKPAVPISSSTNADSKTPSQSLTSAPELPSSHSVLTLAARKAAEATEILSKSDPSGSRQQVVVLMEHWIRLNFESPVSDRALAQYLQVLQQNGVGKFEEQTERFLRYSTELVVDAVAQSADKKQLDSAADAKAPILNYTVADAYSKLLVVLIRHMNNGGTPEELGVQRIALLNKILGTIARTMMSHYERRKAASWDQRPWFRILLNLIQDLNTPSSVLDPISFGINTVLGSAFHVVQPSVIPAFAFAWLELVSHRMFLSSLLLEDNQKGWAIYHQLLIDLFLFLEPHLRKADLNDAMKALHKGTLRVLLVLLHDFPSFLAGYHLSLCNVIPENCIQLRNLILSAFPRSMVLPDPFTPNLKIDLLPEISQNPTIISNVAGPLTSIRADLDSYLKNRTPTDFLSTLLPRLFNEKGGDLNVPRVNSLVLFVGIQAIARLQDFATASKMAHTPEIEVLSKLMELDDYGRYISLNAISNQLRFPSSHTHYFSCVMLYLFGETRDDGVKEQITRVLLERLIVHRPHPWGLLITFIELIKNQRYQFWSHSFVRCATEIEKVFESVARSCMTPGGGSSGPGAVTASQRATTTVGNPQ